MLQTGTLYSITNNENSVEIKQPIPNVFIYFSQNNARKLTAQTDSAGKFSFDLPLGSYQVTVSRGVEAPIYQIAGGAPFELTKDSTVDAFEQWVLAPVYLKPEENPLVILLNTIAKEARDSAAKAKEAEENAKKEVSDADGSGLLVKQSSVKKNFLANAGLYTPQALDVPILKQGDSGLALGRTFLANNPGLDFLPVGLDNDFLYYEIQENYLNGNLVATFKGYNSPILLQATKREGKAWSTPVLFYSSRNTTIDSNGFLKAASPIIKLFDDRIETNGQFKEEPIFEKIGTGTYKISNTLGLAKEGWTYEKPRGKDGNPYFHIKVTKLEDGCIISVHDVFEALEEATITDIDGNERKINKVVKILGEARDIKDHERWIDLRFHEEPEEYEGQEE